MYVKITKLKINVEIIERATKLPDSNLLLLKKTEINAIIIIKK